MSADVSALRKLVLHRTDGLGGRLLALVRVIRFAEAVGAEVSMRWKALNYTNRDLHATDWRLADLFDLERFDFARLDLAEGLSDPLPDGALTIENEPDLSPQLRFGFDAEALFARSPVVGTNGQRLLRVAGETDEEVSQGLAGVFERLVPSAAIRDELAAMTELLGAGPYVVMHIRRGDVVLNLIDDIVGGADAEQIAKDLSHFARRCAPIDVMVAAIDASDPQARVLIFGEDAEAAAEAAALLGSRASIVPAAEKLGPLQRAFLEILMLRDASAIYSTASQFARFPAEVGPARLHEINPEGDPTSWIAHYHREILDKVEGLSAARRDELDVAYMEIWRPIAERADRLRERAARAPRAAARA